MDQTELAYRHWLKTHPEKPTLDIRAWAKEQGLSMRQLAKKLGITPVYLNTIANGKAPGPKLAAKILALTGLDMTE